MAKTGRSQSSSSRRIVILVLLAALLFSFIGYRLYAWYKTERYLSRVDEIQIWANREITRLNQDFSLFQGDPASAKDVLPKFRRGEKVLNQAADQLKRIRPPSNKKVFHHELLTLYIKSSTFCSDLSKVAEFIIKRGELVRTFATAADVFDNQIKSAQKDEEIINASQTLRSSTDKALTELKKLPRPSILVYSNKTLENNLAELSTTLKMIEEGIQAQDVGLVRLAAERLKAIFERDWHQALSEGDKEGIRTYNRRGKELEDLRNRIDVERNYSGER